MEALIPHLPNGRRNPRLWFERLVIFEKAGEDNLIRPPIPFYRGLNLVWAKEPAAGSATGTRAAGHGVGKTSLCLLLRFCMGETSKAVSALRDELFVEFREGGVGAILHVDDEPFVLCRYFNVHKEGTARRGTDVKSMWDDDGEYTDRAFLQMLSETMLKGVSPSNIPETGQVIEWKHILAWISRDQGSRFKSFFAWREEEGTGLRRGRQDPPFVMQAVLGLLEQAEFELMNQLSKLEKDLESAEQKTEELLREPMLIQQRIESELRAWGKFPENLPLRSADFFSSSIESEVKKAGEEVATKLADLEARLDEIDQSLDQVRLELRSLESQMKRAEAECDLADAARRRNEEDYRAAAGRLLVLRQLIGRCEHGGVEFQQCEHISAEKQRLEISTDVRDSRDQRSLQKAMDDSAGDAVAAFQRKQRLDNQIQAVKKQESSLLGERTKARMKRDTIAVESNRGKLLLAELDRWEVSAGSAKSQAAIDKSRKNSKKIADELNGIQTRLAVLQRNRTAREKALAQLVDSLAHELLADEVDGSFEPRDEYRPFKLSIRGGEAYRVLEVLLGDIACLLDSANQESAFPGLLIHDCPREADMSQGLYENFLSLFARLQSELFADRAPPFQYVVTTTTPPPEVMQHEPYLVLDLRPDNPKDLLFKKRFGALAAAQRRLT